MRSSFNLPFVKSTFLAFGAVTTTVVSTIITEPAKAQVTVPTTNPSQNIAKERYFSDVKADYWARPFISVLTERNIITGFPDGTFKPEQPVSRAEFAAMIQKAFNQNPVRQLSTGGFSDVPADYWAISAIQEAYKTGFMSGYPGNFFFPNQQISKVQAIVALTNGLGLTANDTASLASYYNDVNAIPNYATDKVAAATRENLVVNYPQVRQLNPLQPLTRAEAAAHLYQALVRQGKLQPLASNVPVTNYIVGRAMGGSQTNDVFSVAASNSSFTTLTSLLKTSGLAGILEEPGSFTIFAPTDQAFAALPVETLRQLQLPENRETLLRILRYHVVPKQLTANELSSGKFKTLGNNPVNVQVNTIGANKISVNNAQVVQPNIQASNGVIHAINTVLIPPNLTQNLSGFEGN